MCPSLRNIGPNTRANVENIIFEFNAHDDAHCMNMGLWLLQNYRSSIH